MKIRIFILLFFFWMTGASTAQFMAGGDTTICEGGQAQLWASGGGASYFWISDPPDPSILIPQQQNPIASPNVTTMYVCRTNIATGNLILNGTFELGNTGFNSEYTYNPGSITAEGTYAVVSDAHTVHSNFFCNQDHTNGNGLFMAINGSGVANVQVWYLTLPSLQPHTDYEFSTWITSLHATNPAILQFSINGILLADPFQAYPYTCDWYQFFEVWDSGPNTSATISIVNQNTILSGNDFALDDISFAEVEVYYDTVWVYVVPQYNSHFVSPAETCTDATVEIIYTGDAPDTATFQWNFGGATVMSGSGQGPYTLFWDNTGTKEIALVVNPDQCPSPTTINQVEVYDAPEAGVSADATFIPYGTSTSLHGSMSGNPGPLAFSWDPEEKLQDPLSSDPETIALEETTTFVFTVTDETTGCTNEAEVTVIVTGGPLGVAVVANPDAICMGETTQLQAIVSGGTGTNTYTWTSDPPGFSSDIPDPVVAPLTNTTYHIQIDDGLSIVSGNVNVVVNELPLINPGQDQIIPYGSSTSLEGSGSGGSNSYLYHWEPSDLLINPDIPNPITQNLYQNTQFTLSITDAITGCIGEEVSMVVNLDGGPLSVIIFGDQEICNGATATLNASVSGGDPSGYAYQWTDNAGGSYPDDPIIEVDPTSTTIYFVTIDDGFNLADAQFEVVVNPSPEFLLSGNGQIIACPFDSVSLSPSVSQPGWSYLWSNGATSESIKVGSTGIGYDVQEFSLIVTSEFECVFMDEVAVVFDFSACLGIEEESKEAGYHLYPNPTDGKLFLEILKPFDGLVRVYNIYGEKVYQREIDQIANSITQFDLEMLSGGIYFLSINGTTGRFATRFIIQP